MEREASWWWRSLTMPSRRESRSRSEGFKQKERRKKRNRQNTEAWYDSLWGLRQKNPKTHRNSVPSKGVPGSLRLVFRERKPPTPFLIDKSLPQNRRNKKRAEKRRIWRYFKSLQGKVRPNKAQETRGAREQKKELKAAFKSFYLETCNHGEDPPKRHKAKGHRRPCGIPLKAATLNIRGLNGPNGITKRQLIGDVMRKSAWISYFWQKPRLIPPMLGLMVISLSSSAVISNQGNLIGNTPERALLFTKSWNHLYTK